jgi:hypothetical protein
MFLLPLVGAANLQTSQSHHMRCVTIMYAPISFSYLHGLLATLPCTIFAIIDSCSYLWLMDFELHCLVLIFSFDLFSFLFLIILRSLTVDEPALNHHSHLYISSSFTMLFFTLILLGFTWNLVASLKLCNLRVLNRLLSSSTPCW